MSSEVRQPEDGSSCAVGAACRAAQVDPEEALPLEGAGGLRKTVSEGQGVQVSQQWVEVRLQSCKAGARHQGRVWGATGILLSLSEG